MVLYIYIIDKKKGRKKRRKKKKKKGKKKTGTGNRYKNHQDMHRRLYLASACLVVRFPKISPRDRH